MIQPKFAPVIFSNGIFSREKRVFVRKRTTGYVLHSAVLESLEPRLYLTNTPTILTPAAHAVFPEPGGAFTHIAVTGTADPGSLVQVWKDSSESILLGQEQLPALQTAYNVSVEITFSEPSPLFVTATDTSGTRSEAASVSGIVTRREQASGLITETSPIVAITDGESRDTEYAPDDPDGLEFISKQTYAIGIFYTVTSPDLSSDELANASFNFSFTSDSYEPYETSGIGIFFEVDGGPYGYPLFNATGPGTGFISIDYATTYELNPISITFQPTIPMLTAQTNPTNSGIHLSWASGEPGSTYILQRSDGEDPYQTIYDGSGLSYDDMAGTDSLSPIPGTSYKYQVLAVSPERTVQSAVASAEVFLPPVVTLSVPSGGFLNTPLALIASASNPSGNLPITGVKFYDYNTNALLGTGNLSNGTTTSGTWTMNWTPGTFGVHSVVAVATNIYGDTTTSSPAQININVPRNVVFEYSNNFENPAAIGPEWSTDETEVTPIGERRFLGEFGDTEAGDQHVTLSLGGIPQHDEVTISFDLYMLRSWGGYDSGLWYDNDSWEFGLVGQQALVNANFSNASNGGSQSYPGITGVDSFAPFTGSTEHDTLGYTFDGDLQDSVYHMSFTIPDANPDVVFQFFSENSEVISNESWGLDNVVVTAGWSTNDPPPSVRVAVPVQGTTPALGSQVTLSADALPTAQNATVGSVIFYDNGNPIGQGSPTDAPANAWTLGWTPLTVGPHTITAEAIDSKEDIGTSATGVTLDVPDTSGIGSASITSVSQSFSGNVVTMDALLYDPTQDNPGVTYYWSPLSWPDNDAVGHYPQLDWNNNGTHAGKSMTASLPSVGDYTFMVTSYNGHAFSSYLVDVELVPPTEEVPTVTIVTPASALTIPVRTTIELSALAADSDPRAAVDRVEFYNGDTDIGSGELDSTGLYWTTDWTPQTAGSYNIVAQVTATTHIDGQPNETTTGNSLPVNIMVADTESNTPPRFPFAPSTPFSVTTGSSISLTTLAADEDATGADDESKIIYTWHVTKDGSDTANVIFSDSGTNSAQATFAKFAASGVYHFWVVATDPDGLSTTSSSITVTVKAHLVSLGIVAPSSALAAASTFQFSLTGAKDQFGNGYDLSNCSVSWDVSSGDGTISVNGVYTAPSISSMEEVTAAIVDANASPLAFFRTDFSVDADITPPAVLMPTNVAGASFPQAIQLTWDDSTSDDRAGWNIYRLNVQTGAYVQLNHTLITQDLGFNDETAPVQQTSTYRVTLVTDEGVESAPVQLSVYRALHGDPSAPASVSGSPDGLGALQLNWSAVVPVLDTGHAGDALRGYNVYQWNVSQNAYMLVNSSPVASTTFTITGLTSLTSYAFVVRAVDQDGDESANSTSISVTTGDGIGPTAPTGLTATAISSAAIGLTWTASTGSPIAIGYLVYRSTSAAGPFSLVTSNSVNVTTYSDSVLSPTTHYFYQVRAVDSQGDLSEPANIDAYTASAPSAAPYISITSPVSAVLVNDSLVVRGIVDDPNNDLSNWTLALRPIMGPPGSDIVIAQGTTEEGAYSTQSGGGFDAILGTINAMLIRDGFYQLVLQAADAANNTEPDCMGPQIQIQADQKIGDFAFTDTDLSVSANGGSVDITRTYDSLNRSINSGSGYGWQLNIDAQIEESPSTYEAFQTSNEDSSEGNGTITLRTGGSRDVYVTLPTGQRVKFNFSPGDIYDILPNGNDIQAGFTPDGNSFGATLSLLPGHNIIREGTDTSSAYWEANDEFAGNDENSLSGSEDLVDMEEIQGYVLTTADGTKYYFEKAESPDTTSGTREVSLDGDPDTDSPLVVYHLYSGPPVLTKIIDANGNETDISKVPVNQPYAGDTLLAIIPSNEAANETDYTQYVRIARDSSGDATSIYGGVSSDGSGGKEMIEYVYDSTGNLAFVNQKTSDDNQNTSDDDTGSPTWVTTKYEYWDTNPVVAHAMKGMFAPQNVDRNTSASFTQVLSNNYDLQNGALLSMTTFEIDGTTTTPHTTTFGTDLVSRVESVQDALGLTTIYQYDEMGNILFQTDPTGDVTAYTYFANTHNVQSETANYGTRDAHGVVTLNPDAVTHYYTYDDANAQTSDTYTFNGHTTTTSTGYLDAGGQHLVRYTIDATGLVTWNNYDDKGHLTETDMYAGMTIIGEQYTFGALLQKTTYDAYDFQGNLLSTTQWNKDVNGWYRHTKTLNDYDPSTGNLLETRVYGFSTRQYDWGNFDDAVHPDFYNEDDADGLILLQRSMMSYTSSGDLESSTQWIKTGPNFWGSSAITSYEYDDMHRVTKTTDPINRVTQTFYTDSGQVDYTINPLGNVTKNIYNDLGQVIETRTAATLTDLTAGHYTSTFQTYDADGRVQTSTDALGNVTLTIYDVAGNVAETNAAGVDSRSVSDVFGRSAWSADATAYSSTGGATTSYGTHTTYDALGRVISTERYSNVQITVTPDPGSTSSDVGNSQVTDTNPISGDVNGDGIVNVADLNVMASNWQKSVPTGVTPLSFGDLNNDGIVNIADLNLLAAYWQQSIVTELYTISQTHYNNFGQADSTTDASGQTTHYQYDALGQQTEVIQPTVNVANPNTGLAESVSPTTDYEYDALGRQTAVETPWIWTKNPAGAWQRVRLRTETQYDELGNVTAIFTKQVLLNTNGSDGAITPLSATYATYDSFGRKITSTDANGQTTTYAYDPAGNLTDVWSPAVTDPDNPTGPLVQPHTQYQYILGQETAQIVTRGDYHQETTSYTYDAFGRQNSQTLPPINADTITNSTNYDQFGRVTYSVDFDGQVTAYVYSDLLPSTDPNYSKTGRLVYKNYFASISDYAAGAGTPASQVYYTYDTLGRTASMTDSHGTTSYIYDQNNQVTSVTDAVNLPAPDANSGETQVSTTINYLYDQRTGNLIRMYTLQDSATIKDDTYYTYDPLGRLSTVQILKLKGTTFATSNADGTITGSPLITTYSYDAAGNLVKVALPSLTTPSAAGITTTYRYDVQNRLVAETITSAANVPMQTYLYTLRTDGIRTSDLEVTYGSTGAVSSADWVSWTYDADDRLTSETRSSVDPSTVTNPSPTLTALEYSDVYTMDYAGNRLSQTHTDADTSKTGNTTSTYDDRNELTEEDSTLTGNTTYTYDNNGSMITTATPASTTLYTYDLANRLASVNPGTGAAVTYYTYDDAGNRVMEMTASTGTLYITASINPTGYAQTLEDKTITITDDGSAVTLKNAYVLGLDVLAQASTTALTITSTGQHGFFPAFLLHDGHGSTRLLLSPTADGTGSLERYTYDAFGKFVTYSSSADFTTTTPKTNHLYNDESRDPASGFYDLRARFYNPITGTFITSDSYMGNNADPISLHKYLFTDADPINGVDPSGHDFTLVGQMENIGIMNTLQKMAIPAIGLAGLSLLAYTNALSDAVAIGQLLLATGTADALLLYASVMSNTKKVGRAVDNALSEAAQATGAAIGDLKKFKFFPVIKSLMPKIYAFDVGALVASPSWFVLNYNGPLSSQTARNRYNVWRRWGGLMAAAPAGYSLDEFPYASTEQGGPGAIATPVPRLENLVQGGLLSAFYRYSLKGAGGAPFLVVPIPI